MIRLPQCLGICFALVSLSVVSCASGPQRQDPLEALDAEDDASNGPPKEFRNCTAPKQIGGPAPSLPAKAIANHVTGVWVARCTITEEGSVEGCAIVKGLPDSDEHLLQIFHAQKYRPVFCDDNARRTKYTFKVRFK